MTADAPNLANFFVNSLFIFKIGLIVFAALYFVFTLIIIRQVSLMTATVQTVAAPLLRVLSIIYALFALGVVVFFIIAL